MSLRDEFMERGCLLLPGAFPPALAEAMADFLWERLGERRGVRRDDPSSWSIEAPWVGLKDYKREPVFEAIGSQVLLDTIDELLGEGHWVRPAHWGGFLVSFPDRDAADWNIPARGWHVDAHFTHDPDRLFGIRVFTFLSEVPKRGGGTLFVPGSHRLVRRFVHRLSPEERQQDFTLLLDRFKASDPWLARLTGGDPEDTTRVDDFMAAGHEIDGVPVCVDQLCGSPGDIAITHLWNLHATAPNAGPGPRFMRGKDIFRTDSR